MPHGWNVASTLCVPMSSMPVKEIRCGLITSSHLHRVRLELRSRISANHSPAVYSWQLSVGHKQCVAYALQSLTAPQAEIGVIRILSHVAT